MATTRKYQVNATDVINSAISDGAQIQFLHGTQSALNNLATSSIISGAFYLTDDTNRLYIGKGSGANATVEPLSDSIIKVANVAALSSIKPVTGPDKDGNVISSFYYAIAENVLCIYVEGSGDTSGHWIQINPDTDTYINSSEVTLAVSNTTDKATFTAKLTQTTNTKNNSTDHDATIDEEFVTQWGVETDTGLSVTNSGDNTIKLFNEHHLGVSGKDTNLESRTSAAINILDRNDDVVSTVTVIGDIVDDSDDAEQYFSNYITVSTDSANTINISGANLHAEDIKKITQTNDSGTLTTTLTRYRGNAHDNLTTSITPSITYGKDQSHKNTLFDGTQEDVDRSAVATLDVYSIDEVDQLIKNHLTDFDALKYVGVIDERYKPTYEESTEGWKIFNPEDIQHGYTYKVTASNLITTTGILFVDADALTSYNQKYSASERFALIGDLLIADVTEKDENGYLEEPTLNKWDYVPSGDDQTYYGAKLTDRIGFGLYERTSGKQPVEVGQIEFGHGTLNNAADNLITIDQTETDHGTKILLGHNTVTCTPQTLDQVVQEEASAASTEVVHTTALSTQSDEILVVDSITVNSQGHTTGIKSKTLKLLDTNATLKTVSLDPSQLSTTGDNRLVGEETTGILITNTVALNHASGNTDSITDTYRMVSQNQNLTIAAQSTQGATPTVAFNLVWGTF